MAHGSWLIAHRSWQRQPKPKGQTPTAIVAAALLIVLFFIPGLVSASGPELIHHEINAGLDPAKHSIMVRDTITLPENFPVSFPFLLHRGCRVESETTGVTIRRESHTEGVADEFHVSLPASVSRFTVVSRCEINHPLEQVGKEQARGFSTTPGIISTDGTYLAGSSFWYPVIDGFMLTFTLSAVAPEPFIVISQGERTSNLNANGESTAVWNSPEPQEEIYLIAGPFTEYTDTGGRVTAMAFLREKDDALAAKYLEATNRYIGMYEKMLGPYPYRKFALVENFWETGFGMPSFTLLGSTVLRLPFLIITSYPHEILHNWWGNGVIPDYRKGNWSEGLTAYLADHLLKEQQGGGAEYRLSTLQKYADYVLAGRDFPLTAFISRHSSASEAVGYGKSLMFFHMLRLRLGDDIFLEGLRDFYRKNLLKLASFEDLKQSFESVSKQDLSLDFRQWIERAGAPELKLEGVSAKKEQDRYIVEGTIRQKQDGEPYAMTVPVAVTLKDQAAAVVFPVSLTARETRFSILLPTQPLRIDLDPEFDIFRRLDRNEIPPSISQALGAKKMLIILPTKAPHALLEAYTAFADRIGNAGPDAYEVKRDDALKSIPEDNAIVVLGWENRFFDSMIDELRDTPLSVTDTAVTLEASERKKQEHSFVFAGRFGQSAQPFLLIAADRVEALPGLGRKLPHYHKYSYLAFEGPEPANVAKGRWPVVNSPLTVVLPSESGRPYPVEIGKLPQRKPLAELPAVFSKLRMKDSIAFLADEKQEGRGLGTHGLDDAADFIASAFRDAGLKPAGDNAGYFQSWEAATGPRNENLTLKNVVAVIQGSDPDLTGKCVLVGAHYDHLGSGWPDSRKGNEDRLHPGADDNASGVAVLLELARVFGRGWNPSRSVVFIAFTAEEAGRLGSLQYIRQQKHYPAHDCVGMLNLDTVGRLGSGKLLVLGSSSAREWVHIFRGAGFVTGIETAMVKEDLDSSDQISFQLAGVPAVQLFTGAHEDYHRPSDLPEKIDLDGLVKIAAISKEVVEYLAERKEPLTLDVLPPGAVTGQQAPRRVSLGIIPDFSFQETGCRLSGVVPGSPAEACGLRDGDVITAVNGRPVQGLKDLSAILKALDPGSTVVISGIRNTEEFSVTAVLKEK